MSSWVDRFLDKIAWGLSGFFERISESRRDFRAYRLREKRRERDSKSKERKYLRSDWRSGIPWMLFLNITCTLVVFFALVLAGGATGYLLGNLVFASVKWILAVAFGLLFFVKGGRAWATRGIPYIVRETSFQVSPNCFAVRNLFGRRRWGYLLEGGPYSKWPDFMETIEEYSMDLVETKDPIMAKFTTSDTLAVVTEGSLQYRADPEVVNDRGQVRFGEMSDAIIYSGIADTIEAKIGGLGGKREGEDLISHRQAIEEIINHILRFKTPLHLRHSANCAEEGCRWREVRQIDADDILDFYDKHWRTAKNEKDHENEQPGDRSATEERYGIDIEFYALADVDFSPETKKAFEAKKQAELRAEAAAKREAIAEKAIDKGVSPIAAFNIADNVLNPEGPRQNQVMSFEGWEGLGRGIAEVIGKLLEAKKGGA